MNNRVELSVGITQDFAASKVREKMIMWLGFQAPINEQAKNAVAHIHALEGLMSVEKYASLSNAAGSLRDHLGKVREYNVNEFNKGFQAAINLIMSIAEDIDLDAQAATSIAEMQEAAVREAQTLCKDDNDYQAVGNYAQSIIDGCT